MIAEKQRSKLSISIQMVALFILFLLRSGPSLCVQVLGCFGLRQGASGVLVFNALYGLCLARYQAGRVRQLLVTCSFLTFK